MCVPKTSDHIQINIRMPNPSQKPPASSKAPDQDIKDMDILYTFEFKIESRNLKNWCSKDLKDMDVLCIFKFKIESKNLD